MKRQTVSEPTLVSHPPPAPQGAAMQRHRHELEKQISDLKWALNTACNHWKGYLPSEKNTEEAILYRYCRKLSQ